MKSEVQLLLNLPGKRMTLGVVQFNVKGFQSPLSAHLGMS